MRFAGVMFATLIIGIAHAGELPDLPVAVTNNVVASVRLNDGVHLVSAMGLLAGKSWRDTTTAVWHLAPGAT